MADFASSLPIRTEVDADSKVQIKVHSFQTPDGVGNQAEVTDEALWVKPFGSDGTSQLQFLLSPLGATVVDGFYDVTNNPLPSSAGNIAYTRAAAPAITDQVIRITGGVITDDVPSANIHALDTSSYTMGYVSGDDEWDRIGATAGALNVFLTNTSINVDVDGVYDAGTNTNPDNVGVVWHVRNATPGDAQQTFRPTGVTASTVHAIDVALHDESGVAFSDANPLPVYISGQPNDPVHDYATAANVAANATTTNTYTVTAAKTLYLQQWQISGSGRIKGELEIETGVGAGTFTTRSVAFTSTANATYSESFERPIEVAAGVIVRITLTNRDNQAQDLFSFLNGYEV